MTSYFNSATAYYEAVTDKSINTAFWGLTDPGSGPAQAAQNATKLTLAPHVFRKYHWERGADESNLVHKPWTSRQERGSNNESE